MSSFDTSFEDGMQLYQDAPDKAEEEIINMGLSVMPRPTDRHGEWEDIPALPHDLSAATYSELQRLIGKFTNWYGYATCQQKMTEGLRNSAEKQRSFAWARIRKTKTGTVSDKDDATRLDRRYIETDANFEFRDTQYRLLVGIVDGLKRDIETVSRTVAVLDSRREAEGKSVGIVRRGPRGERSAEYDKAVFGRFKSGQGRRGRR